jgi:hypothetical protein
MKLLARQKCRSLPTALGAARRLSSLTVVSEVMALPPYDPAASRRDGDAGFALLRFPRRKRIGR